MPKRYLLSIIYFARALAVIAFIMLAGESGGRDRCSGAVMGLLWLSTVPPTSALVALMFGTRWFATLFGFAFFSHQVGGFLGVWLGGILFERTGSYDVVWWLVGALRRRLRADQPADRGKAGRRAWRRRRPDALLASPCARATNVGSRQAVHEGRRRGHVQGDP